MKEEFDRLIKEIKQEVRELFRTYLETKEVQNKWYKGKEACQILKCSTGTLQNLRIKGQLPFSKIGGTLYYAHEDIMKILHSHKKNSPGR